MKPDHAFEIPGTEIPGTRGCRAPRGALPSALLGGLLLVLAVALGLTACSPRDPELAPPDHTYQTQGVVYGVTEVEGQWPELVIHHQSIPEFVSREGEVSGMDSMTMPFTVSPELSLAEVDEGDAIDFRFEVRWEGHPTLLVTSLERLPQGTVIDFAPGERGEPVPESVEVPEPEEALEPEPVEEEQGS